jgi:hypothetical protein
LSGHRFALRRRSALFSQARDDALPAYCEAASAAREDEPDWTAGESVDAL